MKTINDRISARRHKLNLSQEELAKRIGVTRVSVSKWESGLNQPKGRYMNQLASALGVTVEWLLSGKGEGNSAAFVQNTEPAELGNHKVPVLSYVQAGAWTEPCEVRDFDGGIEYISSSGDVGRNVFAIRIKGRSMEPLFAEGDLILCDPDAVPNPGDFVIAKNGSDEVTFKKYRPRGYKADGSEVFELVPLNEDFPTLSSETCSIAILAKVIEHRRFFGK